MLNRSASDWSVVANAVCTLCVYTFSWLSCVHSMASKICRLQKPICACMGVWVLAIRRASCVISAWSHDMSPMKKSVWNFLCNHKKIFRRKHIYWIQFFLVALCISARAGYKIEWLEFSDNILMKNRTIQQIIS